MTASDLNIVTQHPMEPPFPDGFEEAIFGTGCFWGTEELFWDRDGVWTTAVGYAGGTTQDPSYEDVCSGRTGHAEVTRIVFDPKKISYEDLLSTFWETHDPTQGMRQGNDIGSQYRSIILATTDRQLALARASKDRFAVTIAQAGLDEITTAIEMLDGPFYLAEDHHQQYLHKHPNGYRCHARTGLTYPRD